MNWCSHYVGLGIELVIKKTEPEVIVLDSGYSGPPIVSPKMYSEWDKPVIEAVARVAKRHNVLVQLHQHGYLIKVIYRKMTCERS